MKINWKRLGLAVIFSNILTVFLYAFLNWNTSQSQLDQPESFLW